MKKDELVQLAGRIVTGEATEEEICLYNQLINSFQLDAIELENFIAKKQLIEHDIKSGIYEKNTFKAPLIWPGLYRLAVAAVLLGLISLSLFLLFSSKRNLQIASTQPQNERFKNDVAPGREGAILTLANGKTIVLDNIGNGTIASQSAVKIVKKNGQVIYENEKAASEMVFNTMSTPKGRQYSLILSDGTKVWLNSTSSITFPTAFMGSERKVNIMGEVYFEVAHNVKMPFIVQKGDISVKVLGTHFNMNSYEEASPVKVTLLEGAVSIKNRLFTALISPGQQADLSVNSTIKVHKDVNIEEIMAWKNGLFYFDGTSMESLMSQLSRWYDIEVVNTKKIDELFYAEIPRNTKLSDVLKALELTGKVHFSIEGKKVIVNP